MPQNIWILLIAQAAAMCAAPLVVFVGGLIGKQLAPSPQFATLPIALMVVGTAIAVYPAAMLSARKGRKFVFLSAMVLGILVALIASTAMKNESFLLFTIASIGLGIVIACVQQFRFAAMESVTADKVPQAISRLLLAGIIAAYLGPELVIWGDALPINTTGMSAGSSAGNNASHLTSYIGAFYLLALLYLFAFIVLLVGFKNSRVASTGTTVNKKSMLELVANPMTSVAIASAAIGFAVMSYVMTATPISMFEFNGFSLEETKWVIQSHILAMFVPSLFSGWLIQKLGFVRMINAGIAAYGICLLIAYYDQQFIHYWLSLLLLGVGWNVLFVSGTALLSKSYAPEDGPQVQGLNDLLVFSMQAVASLASGALLLLLGWEMLVLSVLPLLVVLMYFLIRWQRYNSLPESQKTN